MKVRKLTKQTAPRKILVQRLMKQAAQRKAWFKKRAGKAAILMLPQLARKVKGRTAVEYTKNYFRGRSSAPFMSPVARDFDFVLNTPLTVIVPSRNRYDVAAAVEARLGDLAQYVSNFLTHPRYGPEKEVGFVRGDTLRPTTLTEKEPGHYRFRGRGIVVGRPDMFEFLLGRSKDRQAVSPPSSGTYAGWTTFNMNMPADPQGPGVTGEEWYDFTPSKWLLHHPRIPLLGLSARLRPRSERALIAPQYIRLYRKGLVRIALLFGYDEFDVGHGFARDARAISKIVTSPPSRRFTTKDTGPYGYHGPGLGFSPMVQAPGGPLICRRDADHGGAIPVRYPGARRGATIEAEIRLYNFDKASRQSGQQLIDQFISPFRDSDIIHYDGHANYGGGFYVGSNSNDLLWATDMGVYKRDFSPDYQIFSIGACHSAGYFADLFYNELKPTKTPRNFDIVAGVNEESFTDSVHTAVDLIANLMQVDLPVQRNLDYEQILLEINRPTSFRSYIGVFGQPERWVHKRGARNAHA